MPDRRFSCKSPRLPSPKLLVILSHNNGLASTLASGTRLYGCGHGALFHLILIGRPFCFLCFAKYYRANFCSY